MARTREVFPTKRIPHIWAHGPQTHARNPQGNLYFTGDTIYSYRDSYPIGRIVPSQKKRNYVGKSDDRLVLIQEDTYGSTTAKHIGMAKYATRHMRQVEVPVVQWLDSEKDEAHKANLKWFESRIMELMRKALRARVVNRAWKAERAEEQVKEANLYCEFFGMRKRFRCSISPEGLREMQQKATLAALCEAARDEIKRLEREKRYREEQSAKVPGAMARIAAWERGEAGARLQYGDAVLCGRGTMLRVVGDEVQTSEGAAFPVVHARLGLRLVRRVMEAGQDWLTNGHTCHLGPYKVDRIEADGTVHAGCHLVKWSEIERISGQLEYAHAVAESHNEHMELLEDNSHE